MPTMCPPSNFKTFMLAPPWACENTKHGPSEFPDQDVYSK